MATQKPEKALIDEMVTVFGKVGAIEELADRGHAIATAAVADDSLDGDLLAIVLRDLQDKFTDIRRIAGKIPPT